MKRSPGASPALSALTLSVVIVATLIVSPGCVGPLAPQAQSAPPSGSLIVLIKQGQAAVKVTVEVADTPRERAVGLSNRRELGADQGMLFVFSEPGIAPFWMKDTYVPLSLAFIQSNGEIVDIKDMEPLSEDLHYPGQAYQFALEVNQGFFESNGLEAGSVVTILDAQGQERRLTTLVEP